MTGLARRLRAARVSGLLGVAGVVGAFAVATALFVVPGRVEARPWATAAIGYVDLVDGAAALVRTTAPDGSTSWQSRSTAELPGEIALDTLPPTFADSVAQLVTGDPDARAADVGTDVDAMRRVRVFAVTARALGPDGAVTATEIMVADRNGVAYVGSIPTDDGPVVAFSPPVPLLPAEPRAGDTWGGAGTFEDVEYRWTAEVTDEDVEYDGPLGPTDDCVRTVAEFTLTHREGQGATTSTDVWCDGLGNVSEDRAGDGAGRDDRVATLDRAGPADLPTAAPVDADLAGAGPDGAPDDWSLEPTGPLTGSPAIGVPTFTPVYVPGEQPVVVGAVERDGALVALGVGDDGGGVRWRIDTGGVTYSRPGWDPERQLLLFGASDGYVRAVDDRGLFRWAAAADDAVAGTPVVAEGVVVFGGEDGVVRGVDADTGDPRWDRTVDGPVAAGGAVLDGRVVVVDTSGSVRALEPDDGDVAWSHGVGASVEAAVSTVPGGVVVADRDGGVTRLDAEGDVVWSVGATGGDPIRDEPTLVGGQLLVVDQAGVLTALDLEDGSLQWRLDGEFRGSVAEVDDLVVAADGAGDVVVLDATGEEVARFGAGADLDGMGVGRSFTYGPSVGGGHLWVVDDFGFVHALGPEGTVPP